METMFKNSKKIKPIAFLDAANRFLIVVIIVLSGHVLVKYFLPHQNSAPTFSGLKTSSEQISSFPLVSDQLDPVNLYVKRIKARDLFQSLGDKFKTETPAIQKALPALHKQIKLIGILLDNDSKAIVEDLEEKQTHFLSKGESLGTVLLEDIQEDKVIFIYNSQRVEMAP